MASSKIYQAKICPTDRMHGVVLIKGNHSAMVVRCHEDEWTVFYYRDCHMLRSLTSQNHRPYENAMKQARAYVRTGQVKEDNKSPELVAHIDKVMAKYYREYYKQLESSR